MSTARRTARPAPARAADRRRGGPGAVAILKAEKGLAATARFVFISLHEPPKAAVQAGERCPREAFVVLYEKAERKTYEAVVSLTDRARRLLRAHRGRAAADHRRGVHGLRGARAERPGSGRRRCACAASRTSRWRWSTRGRRATRAGGRPGASAGSSRPLTWVRSEPGEHGYARPIEGLVVVVDLDVDGGRRGRRPRRRRDPAGARQLRPRADGGAGQRAVLPGAAHRPQADLDHPARGRVVHRHRPPRRAGRSGACASASRRARGSSCTSSPTTGGRSSTARRWRRCSCPTATRRRPTATRTSSTRASTASAGWRTRSTLGCDCVGEIFYFDGVVNDQDGEPATIANAICMHEEDYGIGWKHTDFRTEEVEVRRLRRLVHLEHRHRRQLRVRVLLVPLHRRHDRVRGQAHGRDLDRRGRGRRRGPSTARSSPRACTARTTSTSSACGWTWRSTATSTRSCRSTPSRCRGGRRTRPGRRG